jgi:hypothetical protein
MAAAVPHRDALDWTFFGTVLVHGTAAAAAATVVPVQGRAHFKLDVEHTSVFLVLACEPELATSLFTVRFTLYPEDLMVGGTCPPERISTRTRLVGSVGGKATPPPSVPRADVCTLDSTIVFTDRRNPEVRVTCFIPRDIFASMYACALYDDTVRGRVYNGVPPLTSV